jgi:hypothetical protein
MFRKARKELHQQLSKYTFTLVVQRVSVPEDCVVDGKVTHYFTTGEEMSISGAPSRNPGSVWVKKKGRRSQQYFGMLLLTDNCDQLPKLSDILVGELHTIQKSVRQFGKQKFAPESQTYKWWINHGGPLYYLATMVLNGTSKSEASLREVLKLQDDYDDVWMLARLILFNNIQGFVDMMDPVKKVVENVKLRLDPVQFVQQLSRWLDDFTIMAEFQKRVPESAVVVVPKKVSEADSEVFVGRKRRQRQEEEYDPDRFSYGNRVSSIITTETQSYQYERPCSPDYELNSPPVSPPYAPSSPPYAPSSPPYAPSSPPYAPSSPPYAPSTPPYAPSSPPYAPSSPPYAPSTPPCNAAKKSFPPLCDL